MDYSRQADHYRWEEGKKRIKFIFFSNFKPSTSSDLRDDFQKWQQEDKSNDKRDVDLLYLQNEFVNKYVDAETSIHQNKTVEQLWEILDEMKNDSDSLNLFDCYFFVFLTFLSTEGINNEAGRLHFFDGRVTLDEIWDKVSQIPAMTNKPKIFLVQADDVKMLQTPRMFTKGVLPYGGVERKIPTDSDRLTILSTLPSRAFGEKNQPSFLIQALVDVMNENKRACDPLDFLSLTVLINRRVLELIGKWKATDEEKSALPVPASTSTLKQLLYLDS